MEYERGVSITLLVFFKYLDKKEFTFLDCKTKEEIFFAIDKD